MDDTQGLWFVISVGDLGEVAGLMVVLLGLLLRVLPATRNWAPRGNAQPVRPGSGRPTDLTDLTVEGAPVPETGGTHDVGRIAPRPSVRA